MKTTESYDAMPTREKMHKRADKAATTTRINDNRWEKQRSKKKVDRCERIGFYLNEEA